MAPPVYGTDNETNGRRFSHKHKFGKHRKLTRWQQKHKVLTVSSTMNNYTDIHYIYDLEPDPYYNITNTTAAMLNNHFYRKKLILGDMSARRSVGSQPLTTVIVIASIFLFITMSITAATVVFCKKKNTVFVLNKSEQDDNDYDLELDDLNNTDVDFMELNEELDLSRLEQQPCCSQRWRQEQFADLKYEHEGYRRMVVSAVVEHDQDLKQSDSKNSGLYKLTPNSDSDDGSPCTSCPKSLDELNPGKRNKILNENPRNVSEILRRLPLGAQTIQYINGKRYLVCELPSEYVPERPRTTNDSEIHIQPNMSSIQGESLTHCDSPYRDKADSVHGSQEGLICADLDDPYSRGGMSHSQSLGVIVNANQNLKMKQSMSSDFSKPR